MGVFHNSGASLLEKDQLCSGVISCFSPASVEVALNLDTENIALDDMGCYMLAKLANDVTYRRLKE